ncbi:MAG: NAD(P)-dependent oxidoreductase [Hungatella sp.]
MKIAAFSCREDEIGYFEGYGKQYGIDLVWTSNAPGLDNAKLVEGCQAVSVITTPIAEDLIRVWHKYGIKVISTRTVGYEHIHYQLAASLGITVSNVSYSAHTVAEYTVMCILMAIRRMKTIMTRYIGQDYSLKQVRGRELCHMTIGVIGTGQIGENMIANLSGFGCKILAYDPYPKEAVKKYAEYVSLIVFGVRVISSRCMRLLQRKPTI